MPIKPENRSRYPANWQTIRDAVRARSGDCCEGSPDFPDCRRPNGWLLNKRTGELTDDGQIAEAWEHADGDKVTKIVLTVGHLDQVRCATGRRKPNHEPLLTIEQVGENGYINQRLAKPLQNRRRGVSN